MNSLVVLGLTTLQKYFNLEFSSSTFILTFDHEDYLTFMSVIIIILFAESIEYLHSCVDIIYNFLRETVELLFIR